MRQLEKGLLPPWDKTLGGGGMVLWGGKPPSSLTPLRRLHSLHWPKDSLGRRPRVTPRREIRKLVHGRIFEGGTLSPFPLPSILPSFLLVLHKSLLTNIQGPSNVSMAFDVHSGDKLSFNGRGWMWELHRHGNALQVTRRLAVCVFAQVQAQLLQFAAKNIGLNPALLTSPINPQHMTMLNQLYQLQLVSDSPARPCSGTREARPLVLTKVTARGD